LCCEGIGGAADILAVVVEKLFCWLRRGEEAAAALEDSTNDGPNVRAEERNRGVERMCSDLEAVRRLRLTADMLYCVVAASSATMKSLVSQGQLGGAVIQQIGEQVIRGGRRGRSSLEKSEATRKGRGRGMGSQLSKSIGRGSSVWGWMIRTVEAERMRSTHSPSSQVKVLAR
jgi:hypothetical protein